MRASLYFSESDLVASLPRREVLACSIGETSWICRRKVWPSLPQPKLEAFIYLWFVTLFLCFAQKKNSHALAGPVPWREEIHKGIADCTKFVALVDHGWLTSYNCLQVPT